MIDMSKIPLDDSKVWDLIGEGNTKGVFQFESRLGRSWCKKIKPRNIEQLAATSSLLRPGCLRAMSEGKSMTQHYSDRKNGLEEAKSLHPLLDPILKDTHFVLIYQEQTMSVGREIAGFDGEQTHKLMKSCGKKDAALMASLRSSFVAGCISHSGISEKHANEIYDNIESANRYAFNRSLTGDTRVETPSGTVTIANIQVGDMVDSPFGFLKVLNKFDHGILPVYQVTFTNGSVITCTANHKFLSIHGDMLPVYEILRTGCAVRTKTDFTFLRSIEYVGARQTYDIEVDHKDHMYYAEGVVTSNSHAVSYAIVGYWSAYMKLYHPHLFYLYWLRGASEKPDTDLEVKELIMSAKNDGVEVLGPTVEHVEEDFVLADNKIYFGICNIKGVTKRDAQKLKELLPDNDTYITLLVNVLAELGKRSVENMIAVGVFSKYGETRSQMSHDVSCLSDLTVKELVWLQTHLKKDLSITDNIKLLGRTKPDGGGCHNIGRVSAVDAIVSKLENPGRTMDDIPSIFIDKEEKLLGVSISYARLDACGDADLANTSCKEFVDGKGGPIRIACEVAEFKEHICKNDKVMCFLTVEDETGELENIVVFPDIYEQFGDMIYEKATLLLIGSRSPKDKNSLIVEKVTRI